MYCVALEMATSTMTFHLSLDILVSSANHFITLCGGGAKIQTKNSGVTVYSSLYFLLFNLFIDWGFQIHI